MIAYCAVPGCNSNSKTTDYTFHRFPNDIILRARWILAVRRPVRTLGSCPVVCRRHFEASLFSGNQGKRKGLARHAVPTLFLPPLLEVVESSPHDAKLSSEAVSKEELIACRACLALTMDDIKTIDRQTHKLTNELAQVKVYQFQTQPVLEILPLLIKNEDNEPQKVASYTKEEYLESDDGAEYLYLDDSDDNTNTIDKVEDIQVKLIKEDSDAYSDIDDDVEYIPENYTDVDSDTLEETRVTVEKERKTVKLEDKDYPTIESFAFFEKQFNCTAKILSKEEQKQQVEERKRKSTSAFCCDLVCRTSAMCATSATGIAEY
ncbi:hypothetical protein MSG28_016137 [Choristoneura fumiferana]|uniref:Uncharacterized protein n=1 Tax=Choristoneura fumiferana TaxID=7141 RepID=A0ACC0K5F4_CHOFU|nr:hypothetical protein MSG28_016137 [Choristoneura fumiferana]